MLERLSANERHCDRGIPGDNCRYTYHDDAGMITSLGIDVDMALMAREK
jgi:hypothetical protein